MALKALMLKRRIDDTKKSLDELRKKDADFEALFDDGKKKKK